MEHKFVQCCETKVVADACNASYLILDMLCIAEKYSHVQGIKDVGYSEGDINQIEKYIVYVIQKCDVKIAVL